MTHRLRTCRRHIRVGMNTRVASAPLACPYMRFFAPLR